MIQIRVPTKQLLFNLSNFIVASVTWISRITTSVDTSTIWVFNDGMILMVSKSVSDCLFL
jgi:hypothetical protein